MSELPTIRLGFAVRVVGRPGLRGPGGRELPHLSVGLIQLRDVLAYLAQIGVRYYRVGPLLAEGALDQLAECSSELAELAEYLAANKLRLTMHLEHGLALAGDDPERASAGLALVEAHAALLAALDAQRPGGQVEGLMVAHLGASSSDPHALERFASRYLALSARARSRLAVEHDHAGFSLGQLLQLNQRCGVPVVFDALHWALHNPERLPLDLALGLALATWPPNVRPKAHLSSARSEAHLLPGRASQPRIVPPYPGQHADFIVAEDLRRLLVAARGLPPFDLMLEAKAGDLALLRLRSEIARLEPTLAARLG
jgi:UV DNA damage endonuclease